jgi:DNA primase
VALGGRILPGRSGDDANGTRPAEPKYKNSQESAIYVKRRTLYGLNWAKKDVVASGEVVVCEGYTDVIGFFQAGLPRAVATCGTALGEEHFTLLRNFGRRIVLAFDADSAGQSAVSRVYEWERKHEVDVAVAALPPGSDPGEMARSDPEGLVRAVAQARPFLAFRVQRVWDRADLTNVEGRARAADAALRAVAEHPDELVRDQYAMEVADRCRLEPDRVRDRLEATRAQVVAESAAPRQAAKGDRARFGSPGPDDRGQPASQAVPGSAQDEVSGGPWDGQDAGPGRRTSTPAPSRPGLEALRFAVHRPEAVADRLDEALFVDDLHRRAFRALVESENLHEAIGRSSPEVADLLRQVTVEEPFEPDGTLGDPVDAVIAQLVREAARRELGLIQARARTNPVGLEEASLLTAQVKRWLAELDDPATCRESADRLLAWINASGQEDP